MTVSAATPGKPAMRAQHGAVWEGEMAPETLLRMETPRLGAWAPRAAAGGSPEHGCGGRMRRAAPFTPNSLSVPLHPNRDRPPRQS